MYNTRLNKEHKYHTILDTGVYVLYYFHLLILCWCSLSIIVEVNK